MRSVLRCIRCRRVSHSMSVLHCTRHDNGFHATSWVLHCICHYRGSHATLVLHYIRGYHGSSRVTLYPLLELYPWRVVPWPTEWGWAGAPPPYWEGWTHCLHGTTMVTGRREGGCCRGIGLIFWHHHHHVCICLSPLASVVIHCSFFFFYSF